MTHPHSLDVQRIGEIQASLDGHTFAAAEDIRWLLQRVEASAVALAEKEQERAKLDEELSAIRLIAADHGWVFTGGVADWLRLRLRALNDGLKETNARNVSVIDRAEAAESALAAERLRASEALNDALLNGTNAMLAAKAEIARLASQLAGVRTAIEQSVAELVVAIGLENQPGTDPLAWLDVVRDRLAAALPAVQAQPETAKPDVRAIVKALGFDPTNHHNALACAYCNPDRLTFAAPQPEAGARGTDWCWEAARYVMAEFGLGTAANRVKAERIASIIRAASVSRRDAE